jgi:hypothetical protein
MDDYAEQRAQADADWEAAADRWEELTGVRPRPFDGPVSSIIASSGFGWFLFVGFLLAVVVLIVLAVN